MDNLSDNHTTPLVLIVDDEPDIRLIVSHTIELLGAEVRQAASGEDAIALINEKMPDLILLDIMMPGVNGHEVARHVREVPEGAHVPVIMLTALDTLNEMVAALEECADDYVTKPFQTRELQARVQAGLRRRTASRVLAHECAAARGDYEKLLEYQRQSSAPEISGSAAHALGQPLAAIIGNVFLLKEQLGDQGKQKKVVESISHCAREMSDMLRTMRNKK